MIHTRVNQCVKSTAQRVQQSSSLSWYCCHETLDVPFPSLSFGLFICQTNVPIELGPGSTLPSLSALTLSDSITIWDFSARLG